MEKKSALRRAASAVKRLFARGATEEDVPSISASTAETPKQARPRPQTAKARPVQRETDIPLDVLDRAYTPPLTSSKASFRSDGADHQTDQEYALGRGDTQWNDEDRFTNKSGDPRIGTHGRTYEPAEARAERSE
ncbi:MAG TPA: hypothetical protein VHL59_05110 [Thermoanaerobaculia bacterium]|nr:hypothetical protein [Thermoanaerobaculia bacterium]